MTNINFDDSRLTAYALGELQGDDAAMLEQALASDPALADEVAAIRETAGLLKSGFAAEPAMGLTTSQREKISLNGAAHRGADVPSMAPALNSPLIFRPRRAWAALGLAAAACFVVAVIMTNSDQRDRISKQMASDDTTNGRPGDSIHPPPGSSVKLGLELETIEDKNKFVADRLSKVDRLQREMKLEEALQATNEILAVDPNNSAGQGLRAAIETTIDYRKYSEAQQLKERGVTQLSIGVQRSMPAPGRSLADPASEMDSPPPAPRKQSADFSGAPSLDLDTSLQTAVGNTSGPGDSMAAGVAGREMKPDAGLGMRPTGSAPRPMTMPATPASSGGGRNGGGGGSEGVEIEFAWQTGPEGDPNLALRSPGSDGNWLMQTKVQDGKDEGRELLGEIPLLDDSLYGYENRFGAARDPRVDHFIDADLQKLPIDTIARARNERLSFLRAEQRARSQAVNNEVLARCVEEVRQLDRHLRSRIAAGEQYNLIVDNPFIKPVGTDALSTFSVDVDTASFSNVRRFITDQHVLPPKDAVRIEELVNYFDFDYEAPTGEAPFSTHVEVNAAPWKPQHRLVKIGLRGKDIKIENRPATNLVFLIDVSGSMNEPNKLPLVKESLKALVNALHGDDRLAIVTYAGNAGLAMNSLYVNVENKPAILAVIDSLSAGGGTNGAGGIQIAYQVAQEFFIKQGVNRVILCTDGDFNVGVSDQSELVRLIEEKRTTGVYLSVLGFGTGNFQDGKMEQLANHGNGAFAYIDSIDEGRRVLVEKMAGTLVTIAKDVKIQVEFNPAKVQAYRLIGYENRVMAAQDFNDDRKDAGEIGAGHTVTALYEVVPMGVMFNPPPIDDLKYQAPAVPATAATSQPAIDEKGAQNLPVTTELLTVKLRYKQPDAVEGAESLKIEMPVNDPGEVPFAQASADYQFAAALAEFGMILRDSPHRGLATYESVLDLAAAGLNDAHAKQRDEFIRLVEQARAIAGR